MSTDSLIIYEVEAYIIILGYKETIILDILGIATYDIILGLP